MTDEYFEQFLGDETPAGEDHRSNKVPAWVSDGNSSRAAYDAIAYLKKKKLRYIKGHNKKDFTKKLLYQVSKVEVAEAISRTPQSIFRTASYSIDLLDFFNAVNKDLEKKVRAKSERKKHGLQHMSKEQLKTKTRGLSQDLQDAKKSNCEELYGLLLSNMPLDIKKKLGLK